MNKKRGRKVIQWLECNEGKPVGSGEQKNEDAVTAK